MPLLREFDTQDVHPWYKPAMDTQGTLRFPRPFIAPPRVPHGFRRLDISCAANIRIQSTVEDVTESSADCHIKTWHDTIFHGGIAQVFTLAPGEVEFQTGEYTRLPREPESVRINFERPFATPPKVVVFFNLLDLDKNFNWRLRTTATDIDPKGFTLNITTWADTILYFAQACWIAYPEDREHIFSTSVHTRDVRPCDQPRREHNRRITFGDVEFWKDPSVFVALNSIDIDHGRNLPVNAYVDGVSRSSLVWHIDTWADTILYSAGASIIAFN